MVIGQKVTKKSSKKARTSGLYLRMYALPKPPVHQQKPTVDLNENGKQNEGSETNKQNKISRTTTTSRKRETFHSPNPSIYLR